MIAAEAPPPPLAEQPTHVPDDRVFDIDMYAPPGIENGFQEAWKALQDKTPDLIWTPRNEGHWILMRGQPLHAALADWERFSSRIVFVPKSAGEQHTLPPGVIDPPDHKRFRSALNDGLSQSLLVNSKSLIRDLVTNLIEGFRARGSCNFSEEFADVLPIRMFMLLMDLPMVDAPKLKFWTDQITRPDGQMTFKEAGDAFREYLRPFVAARMETPGTDVMSRMIVSGMDEKNGILDLEELTDLSGQVLSASLDTVVSFLSFAFLHLATHDDDRRQLAANPAMLPRALEELFRRFPLVTTGRVVVSDTELLGQPLKQGDMLLLPTALFGLDDRLNDDPLKVDFARKQVNHATFGSGNHRCPGANLARLEMAIVMEEWLSRIPDFHVKPDSAFHYQGGIVGCIRDLELAWPVQPARAAA